MSKSKKKTVANTAPKFYTTPFGPVRYYLIQDVKQLRTIKGELGEALRDSVPSSGGFEAVTWMTHVDDEGYFIGILYPDMLEHPDMNRMLAVLCHECVHVWQFFHKEVICEEYPSDEFEAYTIDSIFANMLGENRRLLDIHQDCQQDESEPLQDAA